MNGHGATVPAMGEARLHRLITAVIRVRGN